MTAPDRIWAVHHETHGAKMIGEWADTIRHLGGTEYVRADIAADLLAALEGLLGLLDAGALYELQAYAARSAIARAKGGAR